VAERVSREVLSLPMYAELSGAQIERVVDAVTTFTRASRRQA
jgi:dTDP-4-amino-4,6-dideoxygalactose transaminase